MSKKFFPLFFICVLILSACGSGSDDDKTPGAGGIFGSSSGDNSDSGGSGDSGPLPPVTGTLMIQRTGIQSGGLVEWHLSGTVEIDIPLDETSWTAPHLAIFKFQEEEEEAIQAFKALGDGAGTWMFVNAPNCEGGGEFNLSYEIEGELNKQTGSLDMNLVEKWVGGSSTVTCAGKTETTAIPPGEIPLGSVKVEPCEQGTPKAERMWTQDPEAGGGITWTDQYNLEDLKVPDALTKGEDAPNTGEDADASANQDAQSDAEDTGEDAPNTGQDADANQQNNAGGASDQKGGGASDQKGGGASSGEDADLEKILSDCG